AAAREERDGLMAGELCIHISELVVARPDISEPADFVSAVAALDSRTALRYLMGDLARDAETTALLDRAIDGDDAALAAIGERLPEYKRDHQLQLVRESDRVLERLITILSAWE